MRRPLVLLLLSLSAATMTACTRDEQPKPSAASAARTSRTWRCASLATPGGETLGCTSSSLTYDSPPVGESCSGPTDNPDLCGAPSSGGTWSDYDSQYVCTAGASDCPPVAAQPGVNVGSGGASASGDAPSNASDNGGTIREPGGGSGGGGDDDDDGKGKDDKKNKNDGKNLDMGGTVGPGSGESYDCRSGKKGIECVRHTTPGSASGSAPSSGGLSGGGATTSTSTGKSLTFDGSKANGDGTSTWCWTLTEVSGQDISNWVIGTGRCEVVSRTPSNASEIVRSDPNSGLMGVKWETGGGFQTGQFCVTVNGAPSAGTIKFSVKAPDVAYGLTTGPVCQ
jgi:hypothetical protein